MEKTETDEYLEALWYLSEQNALTMDSLQKYVQEIFNEAIVEELVKSGLIKIKGKTIELTGKGYEQSKQIVRSHRLAERLLTDVLGMKTKETEQSACEFEHILAPEITDSICTLLGHPRECPHGFKIPEGKCCIQARQTLTSAVVPLDRVKIGEKVKISYIKTLSNSRMHKLSHFGIIPGSYIKVHQKYPSFVIQCENTQLALEDKIAKEIFVFYPENEEQRPKPFRRKWRFGRRHNTG